MKVFEVNGKMYAVVKPNLDQQRESQKIYNRAFSDAVNSKAILREAIDQLMRDQNLWDDEKQAELKSLSKELSDIELRLAKGGIKRLDAKELCLRGIKIKAKIRDLVSVRSDLDVNTCQGQADNARFNYYVSVCLVYNDSKKPVYSSLDEYIKNSTDEVAYTGARKFADLYYGLDENYEANTIENKVLKKLGFINDKLEFIDKDGNKVDESGRRVNDKGDLINSDGKVVDVNGNLLDEDGNFIVDSAPFLDDDGNPIVDPVMEVKKE